MNGGFGEGLKLEQAPPLAIPASFFLLAPCSLIAAGLLLLAEGQALLWTRFAGATAALAHLGTLGFLGSVMLGALYQMIPVVAGAPVPLIRAAHLVHAAYAAGVAALVVGLAANLRSLILAGASALALSLLGFLVAAGIALARAPAGGRTVWGMRLAVAGLLAVTALGIVSSFARASAIVLPALPSFILVHLALGIVVWIGALLTCVSFQVVPMFYLTPGFPIWVERLLIGLVASSFGLLLAALALGAEPIVVAACALPGAAAIWLVHPIVTLLLLRRRRRKRRDPSLAFWKAGLSAGLLALPLGAAAVLADDTRWPLAFGWTVLFGWAGLVVHGMLGRIVPFLVWFHRFSRRVGLEAVPSMKQLLPDALPRLGFVIHATTLLAGLAALAFGLPLLARITGAGVALTGLALLATIVRTLGAGRS
jgi:hypothetical protein